MTPDEAIRQLAAALTEVKESFSGDDVYDALEQRGVPEDVADRAYKFGQLACGRKFLGDLGKALSGEYICFNADGEVMESGQIEQESYYSAAAEHIVPEVVGGAPFSRFALMSAEVNSVNKALIAGMKPADLAAAPAFLFLEVPTESGLAKAHEVMAQHIAKLQSGVPPRKPWWKFW